MARSGGPEQKITPLRQLVKESPNRYARYEQRNGAAQKILQDLAKERPSEKDDKNILQQKLIQLILNKNNPRQVASSFIHLFNFIWNSEVNNPQIAGIITTLRRATAADNPTNYVGLTHACDAAYVYLMREFSNLSLAKQKLLLLEIGKGTATQKHRVNKFKELLLKQEEIKTTVLGSMDLKTGEAKAPVLDNKESKERDKNTLWKIERKDIEAYIKGKVSPDELKAIDSSTLEDIEAALALGGSHLITAIKELEKIPGLTGIAEYFADGYIYLGKKIGGKNEPGDHGGRYKHIKTGNTYLFKQDTDSENVHHVDKDISEFVGAQLMNFMQPANPPDDPEGIAPDIIVLQSPDGKDKAPYIGSKFFPDYKDLDLDIFENYYQLPLLRQKLQTLSQPLDEKAIAAIRREAENFVQNLKHPHCNPAFSELLKQLKDQSLEGQKALIEDYLVKSESAIPSERIRAFGTQQKLGTKNATILRAGLLHRRKDGERYYQNIESCLVVSLMLADFDVHLKNLGPVTVKGVKKLKRIDIGAALKAKHFEDKQDVNIEGISKHIPGWEPTNHIREFPTEIRYSLKFAAAIDEANLNLQAAIDRRDIRKLAEKISAWPEDAQVKFALHIGMKGPIRWDDKLIENIGLKLESNMQERMQAMRKLSVEIKISHFFFGEGLNVQLNYKKRAELEKLIKDNFDIFEKEKFTFRGKKWNPLKAYRAKQIIREIRAEIAPKHAAAKAREEKASKDAKDVKDVKTADVKSAPAVEIGVAEPVGLDEKSEIKEDKYERNSLGGVLFGQLASEEKETKEKGLTSILDIAKTTDYSKQKEFLLALMARLPVSDKNSQLQAELKACYEDYYFDKSKSIGIQRDYSKQQKNLYLQLDKKKQRIINLQDSIWEHNRQIQKELKAAPQNIEKIKKLAEYIKIFQENIKSYEEEIATISKQIKELNKQHKKELEKYQDKNKKLALKQKMKACYEAISKDNSGILEDKNIPSVQAALEKLCEVPEGSPGHNFLAQRVIQIHPAEEGTDVTLQDVRKGFGNVSINDCLFVSPKLGGANDPGKYGGNYIQCYVGPDGQVQVETIFFKQATDDGLPNHRENIAEVIAGNVMMDLIGDNAAGVFFARPQRLEDAKIIPDSDQTYVASIFLHGFRSAHEAAFSARIREKLIKEYEEEEIAIRQEMKLPLDNEAIAKSVEKRLKATDIALQMKKRKKGFKSTRDQVFKEELAKLIASKPKEEKYNLEFSFGKGVGVSLLLGNYQIHSENLGLADFKRQGKTVSEFGILDYGGAARRGFIGNKEVGEEFSKEIHPLRARNKKWFANYLESYPLEVRLSKGFIDGLAKVANFDANDLQASVTRNIDGAVRFYGAKDFIENFAKELASEQVLGFKTEDNDAVKVEKVKAFLARRMVERQFSLKKFVLKSKLASIQHGNTDFTELALAQAHPVYFQYKNINAFNAYLKADKPMGSEVILLEGIANTKGNVGKLRDLFWEKLNILSALEVVNETDESNFNKLKLLREFFDHATQNYNLSNSEDISILTQASDEAFVFINQIYNTCSSKDKLQIQQKFMSLPKPEKYIDGLAIDEIGEEKVEQKGDRMEGQDIAIAPTSLEDILLAQLKSDDTKMLAIRTLQDIFKLLPADQLKTIVTRLLPVMANELGDISKLKSHLDILNHIINILTEETSAVFLRTCFFSGNFLATELQEYHSHPGNKASMRTNLQEVELKNYFFVKPLKNSQRPSGRYIRCYINAEGMIRPELVTVKRNQNKDRVKAKRQDIAKGIASHVLSRISGNHIRQVQYVKDNKEEIYLATYHFNDEKRDPAAIQRDIKAGKIAGKDIAKAFIAPLLVCDNFDFIKNVTEASLPQKDDKLRNSLVYYKLSQAYSPNLAGFIDPARILQHLPAIPQSQLEDFKEGVKEIVNIPIDEFLKNIEGGVQAAIAAYGPGAFLQFVQGFKPDVITLDAAKNVFYQIHLNRYFSLKQFAIQLNLNMGNEQIAKEYPIYFNLVENKIPRGFKANSPFSAFLYEKTQIFKYFNDSKRLLAEFFSKLIEESFSENSSLNYYKQFFNTILADPNYDFDDPNNASILALAFDSVVHDLEKAYSALSAEARAKINANAVQLSPMDQVLSSLRLINLSAFPLDIKNGDVGPIFHFYSLLEQAMRSIMPQNGVLSDAMREHLLDALPPFKEADIELINKLDAIANFLNTNGMPSEQIIRLKAAITTKINQQKERQALIPKVWKAFADSWLNEEKKQDEIIRRASLNLDFIDPAGRSRSIKISVADALKLGVKFNADLSLTVPPNLSIIIQGDSIEIFNSANHNPALISEVSNITLDKRALTEIKRFQENFPNVVRSLIPENLIALEAALWTTRFDFLPKPPDVPSSYQIREIEKARQFLERTSDFLLSKLEKALERNPHVGISSHLRDLINSLPPEDEKKEAKQELKEEAKAEIKDEEKIGVKREGLLTIPPASIYKDEHALFSVLTERKPPILEVTNGKLSETATFKNTINAQKETWQLRFTHFKPPSHGLDTHFKNMRDAHLNAKSMLIALDDKTQVRVYGLKDHNIEVNVEDFFAYGLDSARAVLMIARYSSLDAEAIKETEGLVRNAIMAYHRELQAIQEEDPIKKLKAAEKLYYQFSMSLGEILKTQRVYKNAESAIKGIQEARDFTWIMERKDEAVCTLRGTRELKDNTYQYGKPITAISFAKRLAFNGSDLQNYSQQTWFQKMRAKHPWVNKFYQAHPEVLQLSPTPMQRQTPNPANAWDESTILIREGGMQGQVLRGARIGITSPYSVHSSRERSRLTRRNHELMISEERLVQYIQQHLINWQGLLPLNGELTIPILHLTLLDPGALRYLFDFQGEDPEDMMRQLRDATAHIQRQLDGMQMYYDPKTGKVKKVLSEEDAKRHIRIHFSVKQINNGINMWEKITLEREGDRINSSSLIDLAVKKIDLFNFQLSSAKMAQDLIPHMVVLKKFLQKADVGASPYLSMNETEKAALVALKSAIARDAIPAHIIPKDTQRNLSLLLQASCNLKMILRQSYFGAAKRGVDEIADKKAGRFGKVVRFLTGAPNFLRAAFAVRGLADSSDNTYKSAYECIIGELLGTRFGGCKSALDRQGEVAEMVQAMYQQFNKEGTIISFNASKAEKERFRKTYLNTQHKHNMCEMITGTPGSTDIETRGMGYQSETRHEQAMSKISQSARKYSSKKSKKLRVSLEQEAANAEEKAELIAAEAKYEVSSEDDKDEANENKPSDQKQDAQAISLTSNPQHNGNSIAAFNGPQRQDPIYVEVLSYVLDHTVSQREAKGSATIYTIDRGANASGGVFEDKKTNNYYCIYSKKLPEKTSDEKENFQKMLDYAHKQILAFLIKQGGTIHIHHKKDPQLVKAYLVIAKANNLKDIRNHSGHEFSSREIQDAVDALGADSPYKNLQKSHDNMLKQVENWETEVKAKVASTEQALENDSLPSAEVNQTVSDLKKYQKAAKEFQRIKPALTQLHTKLDTTLRTISTSSPDALEEKNVHQQPRAG